MGHMDKKIEENKKMIVKLFKIQRKNFLKMIMWPRILKKIKIVFMLRNPPLIRILQEDLILMMELIRDCPKGVSKYPRSI